MDGNTGVAIGVIVLAAMKAFEVFGKTIPDSATGFWGTVRKISKLAALYVSNKA